MPQRVPVAEFKRRYDLLKRDDVFDETTYTKMTAKARFIDPVYGEYWSKPNDIMHNHNGHKARQVEKCLATKIKNNSFSRVGCKGKNKIPFEEIERKIKEINPNVSIVKESYVNVRTNCTFHEEGYGFFTGNVSKFFGGRAKGFPRQRERAEETWIKKYGSMESLYKIRADKAAVTLVERYGEKGLHADVIQDKVKATMIKNHGVWHQMQSPKVALQAAKSSTNVYLLHHWQTNEELVCVASYEVIVVLYFNANKIPFEFQSKTFKLPTLNTTYRPDFYLPEEDKWIEVKGYFRKSAKAKWEVFHEQYPNSELWQKEKLMELGLVKNSGHPVNKKETQQYRYIKPTETKAAA